MELLFVAPENTSPRLIRRSFQQPPVRRLGQMVPLANRLSRRFPKYSRAWNRLQRFDVMLISQDKLSVLKRDHSPQWKAICDWLHSGGNLIVYDAGKPLDRPRSGRTACRFNNFKRSTIIRNRSIQARLVVAGGFRPKEEYT